MPMRHIVIALSLVTSAVPGLAAETITYTYDAKGRLVAVVHSGTVNNGVNVTYQHDHADNRNRVVVTGAPH